MPANIFPLVVGDPTLKSCRHSAHQGDRRVSAPSICLTHTRTCMTCCSSRLQRRCGLGSWYVPPQPVRTAPEILAGLAEMAQIRRELGFRPLRDDEAAEERQWALRNAKETAA